MLLRINDLQKGFGQNIILNNVNVAIEDKSRIGLIGINGAGKSTLLNLISGRLEPDEGELARGSSLSVGFLQQNSGLDRTSTIYEEMLSIFAPLLTLQKEMRDLEKKMSEAEQEADQLARLSEQYAARQIAFEHGGGYLIEVKVKTILNGMGFGAAAPNTPIATLSGGEKTRLAMARLLLEEPNLLLLDEPTNHLDFKTLMWLEDYLSSYNGAILVVSHDRYFLDKVVTEVWELARTVITVYPGNYSKYRQLRQERFARLEKEYEQQQKHIAELQDYIDRNMARASTSNSAKGRLKALEKIEVMDKPVDYVKHMTLRFAEDRQPYKDLLEIKGLKMSVGEEGNRKNLFENLDLSVQRGERVAIIGANGVGKTSLLKAIQGLLPTDSGRCIWGQNASIGYYEQENGNLHADKSALDELWDRFKTRNELEIRSALGRVLLTGENVFKPVGVLSGGERAKLSFAILAFTPKNVLILDEPTNHLDLLAKEDLERALTEYSGTLIFVSHDRYLLNCVPTRIVELCTDGAKSYHGNYDYYAQEIARERELAAQAAPVQEPRVTASKSGYRSREQKSGEVKIKNRLREIERMIETCEQQIALVEQELASENVYSDYRLMNEKCAQLEQLKLDQSQYYEEWDELSELA